MCISARESIVCCFTFSYLTPTDDPEFPTENTKLDHNAVEPQQIPFLQKRFEKMDFLVEKRSVLALTTSLSASTRRTGKCTPFLWGLSRGVSGNVRNHQLQQNLAAVKKWIRQESRSQLFFYSLKSMAIKTLSLKKKGMLITPPASV